jgi:hypothetical protein
MKIKVRKKKIWDDITGMIILGGGAVGWKKEGPERGTLFVDFSYFNFEIVHLDEDMLEQGMNLYLTKKGE